MPENEIQRWLDQAPEDYKPIIFPHVTERGFVSGKPDPQRFWLKHYLSQSSPGADSYETPLPIEGHRTKTKLIFGPYTEGPPGHAHGGSIAAVLDEIMGGMILLSGRLIVASSLNISFQQMVPLESPIIADAWIENIEGRKVYAHGILYQPEEPSRTLAKGQGTFVQVAADKLDFSKYQHP